MSLKAFHILFVVVSTMLAVGFGIWAIGHYRIHHDTMSLVAGLISLMAAVVLVWYGRWFLRKLKDVSYL